MINKIIKLNEKLKDKWYFFSGRIRACYYKRAFGQCGKNLKINGKPKISSPEKIFVGDNVTINSDVQLCPRGRIIISNDVVMSRGAQITAGGLDTSHWVDGKYKDRVHNQKDIFIGEGAWLCVNSTILCGANLTGKGIIVAAGAVVTKEIEEDYCVVAGVPARVIKKLT